MTLQWSSIQPVEPGTYFAAYAGSERFTLLVIADDGTWHKPSENTPADPAEFDLYSWPVRLDDKGQPIEVPPAPVREIVPPAPVRPQKDVKDVSKPAQA